MANKQGKTGTTPKKQDPTGTTGTTPKSHVPPGTKQTFSSTEQPTDDVVLEAPAQNITVSSEGVVAAATEGAEPLKAESLKDGLTAAQAQTADTIEGGPPGLAGDTKRFTLGLSVQLQIIAILAGFRFFMKAVKRPQYSEKVPGAISAVVDNWKLLVSLVPAALTGINVTTLTALLARLTFVKSLVEMVDKCSERLSAVQSHLEDQLVTMVRPLYDNAGQLLSKHDLLVDLMLPLVELFSLGGKQAAESRQNNQKVAGEAVANAEARDKPPAPPVPPMPSITVTPGTVTPPGPGTPPAPTQAGPKAPTRH